MIRTSPLSTVCLLYHYIKINWLNELFKSKEFAREPNVRQVDLAPYRDRLVRCAAIGLFGGKVSLFTRVLSYWKVIFWVIILFVVQDIGTYIFGKCPNCYSWTNKPWIISPIFFIMLINIIKTYLQNCPAFRKTLITWKQLLFLKIIVGFHNF